MSRFRARILEVNAVDMSRLSLPNLKELFNGQMMNAKETLFTDTVLPPPFSLDELFQLPMFRPVTILDFLSESVDVFHPSVKISSEVLLDYLTKGQGRGEQTLILKAMFIKDSYVALLEKIVKDFLSAKTKHAFNLSLVDARLGFRLGDWPLTKDWTNGLGETLTAFMDVMDQDQLVLMCVRK